MTAGDSCASTWLGCDGANGAWLSLECSARLIAGHLWWERSAAALSGRWVAEYESPALRVWLARVASESGEAAGVWRQLMPETHDLDPERLLADVAIRGAKIFEALESAQPGAVRLAGLVRFGLLRLISSYRRHLGVASEVADAPVVRQLKRLLPERLETWEQGEKLLVGEMRQPEQVMSVGLHLARLEQLCLGLA